MDKLLCDICGQEMKFKEHVKSKKKYRIRRFICDCGHQQTIFADGWRDIKNAPDVVQNDIDKFFKNEEDNRDF